MLLKGLALAAAGTDDWRALLPQVRRPARHGGTGELVAEVPVLPPRGLPEWRAAVGEVEVWEVAGGEAKETGASCANG